MTNEGNKPSQRTLSKWLRPLCAVEPIEAIGAVDAVRAVDARQTKPKVLESP